MSSKPIDTIQLLLALIGLIKSASIAVSVVSVEWALARKAKAENNSAILEGKLDSMAKKKEFDDEVRDEDPINVVDNILSSSDGSDNSKD